MLQKPPANKMTPALFVQCESMVEKNTPGVQ